LGAFSDGTAIAATDLSAGIRENKVACWPDSNPLPERFHPRRTRAIAPTVRDTTLRRHQEGGCPATEEKNRTAVSPKAANRIFRVR
jgi:hypothetical protein